MTISFSWPVWRPYLLATGIMALAMTLAWLLQPYVSLPNLVLLFVLAAVCVAFLAGQGPALLASVLAGVAYAVVYVPWHYVDLAESGQYLITMAITVGLSVLISQLATRWRDKAMESAARAQELDRLYRYTRELETEKLRNSVLSALSHDLRTPLASLVGASSSLLSDELSLQPQARQELAELIYDESRRMQLLVENLLELARLESGPVQLQQDWQALEEILGAVIPPWRRTLAPRGIRVSLPEELPLLRFDPRLIERVFANLLENIGKYTPEETQVQIQAYADSDSVIIQVMDDGPGFTDDADRLFEKFYRGDMATPGQGAGLGLAICRAIMEAHGGSIQAAHRQPRGTVFTLTLPRATEPLPEPPEGEAS